MRRFTEEFPHATHPDSDLRATTRAHTGDTVRRAYVIDRKYGHTVYACPHRHHNYDATVRCAEQAVKRLYQNTAFQGQPSEGDAK